MLGIFGAFGQGHFLQMSAKTDVLVVGIQAQSPPISAAPSTAQFARCWGRRYVGAFPEVWSAIGDGDHARAWCHVAELSSVQNVQVQPLCRIVSAYGGPLAQSSSRNKKCIVKLSQIFLYRAF